MMSTKKSWRLYEKLKDNLECIEKEYGRRFPIYETFKWWARRYATIAHVLVEFVKENYPCKQLLDPFMGGGTIVLEAAKSSVAALGIEINPLPIYQLETLLTTDIDDILSSANFLENVHAQIWKTVWGAKYGGETFEIIHTIYTREGTNLQPQEYELYSHNSGERFFVSAEDVKPKYTRRTKPILLHSIPKLKETTRLLNEGFRTFNDLMTPRQLATIKYIAEQLSNQDKKTQRIITGALADSVRSLSLLAYYSKKYQKVIPGFVIKSYWLPKQPVELNPLSHKKSGSGIPLPIGRGNLFSYIRKLYRAKLWGEPRGYFDIKPRLILSDAINFLSKSKIKFDCVITDPPYFDTQQYLDLSVFGLSIIYSVNKMAENTTTKEFNDIVSWIKKREIIPHNDKEEYFQKLRLLFSLLQEKTPPGAPIIFSFHHRDPSIEMNVFETAANFFRPLGVYIVPGESSGKLGRGRMKCDYIFYLENDSTRKRKYTLPIFWVIPRHKVQGKERRKIDTFIHYLESFNIRIKVISQGGKYER